MAGTNLKFDEKKTPTKPIKANEPKKSKYSLAEFESAFERALEQDKNIKQLQDEVKELAIKIDNIKNADK